MNYFEKCKSSNQEEERLVEEVKKISFFIHLFVFLINQIFHWKQYLPVLRILDFVSLFWLIHLRSLSPLYKFLIHQKVSGFLGEAFRGFRNTMLAQYGLDIAKTGVTYAVLFLLLGRFLCNIFCINCKTKHFPRD